MVTAARDGQWDRETWWLILAGTIRYPLRERGSTHLQIISACGLSPNHSLLAASFGGPF